MQPIEDKIVKNMDNKKAHHKWEQGIIHLLNLDGWNLEWTGENFSHYDAKGKTPKGYDCVIEFKLRDKYYSTKILEQYKYSKLMQEPNCMKFYYVFDCKGNYLYHLDTLKLPELEIKKLQNNNIDKQEKNKEVFMLSESQASITNKY
jgi:hypothetical protein